MKIHIFGASGSGVSTLGRFLAERYAVPYFDADDFYWMPSNPPFTQKRPIEERQILLREALSRESAWILGGSLVSWADFIKFDIDCAVYLWLEAEIRVERLKKREFERYGNVIFSDTERNTSYRDFIEWAAQYDQGTSVGRNRERHAMWIQTLPCPILRIEDDISVEERAEKVMDFLKKLG